MSGAISPTRGRSSAPGGAGSYGADAGGGGAGVYLTGVSGRLTNTGHITGGEAGASLSYVVNVAGGVGVQIDVRSGSIDNSGTITGGAGGGTGGGAGVGFRDWYVALSNTGVITGGFGGGAGVDVYRLDTITNGGSIVGGVGSGGDPGGTGVSGLLASTLTNRGAITGGAGGAGGDHAGAIDAGEGGGGIHVQSYELGAGVLVNDGTITGGVGGGGHNDNAYFYGTVAGGSGGYGVSLEGGQVTNNATIAGGAGGVGATNGLSGSGVLLGGGTITNGGAANHTALITGNIGIQGGTQFGDTVINYGVIEGTGGLAVQFSYAGGVFVAETGSKAVGAVQGGGGTLALPGGTGTITGLGVAASLSGSVDMAFSGFGSYVIDAGASWTLAGAHALTDQTITNFGTLLGTLVLGSKIPLIVEPGAHFGTVKGDGGALELADATATITGLGGAGTLSGAEAMIFSGFGSYVIEAGSALTLAGTNTLRANQTLTNFGTIAGSLALKSASARLIAETGSHSGTVAGGGGTLELTLGTGAISGLGATATLSGGDTMTFSSFGSYVFDRGGDWALAGTDVLGASQTLTNSGILTVSGELVDKGSLDNMADGTIALDNGEVAEIEGVITNAGVIAIDASASLTDLRVLAAGATLTGGGTIGLGGAKSVILGVSPAATLTNANDTIAGEGYLGNAELTLVNNASGVIDANGAGDLIVRTSGETLVNQGLIEASGPGLLVLADTTVDNVGGTIAATDARVDIDNSTIIGGILDGSGVDELAVNTTGAVLDGSSGQEVELNGSVALLDGASLALEGAITNTGTIALLGKTHLTELLIGAGGATLLGGGLVSMTSSAVNEIGAGAATTLTNVDNFIAGAGTIGDADLTLVNEASGVINSSGAIALVIDTGANTIVNAGQIDGQTGGGMVIESALDNTGLIDAYHGDLTVQGAVNGDGTADVSGGTLAFGAGFSEDVRFTDTALGGSLVLADSEAYDGTITGFSLTGGTSLDLEDIPFVSGATTATYSGDASSGLLTVKSGAQVARIRFDGDYIGSVFKVSSDGHGGTTIVDPAKTASPSVHAFIAAAAAMPAPAGAPDAPVHEPWVGIAPMLARPVATTSLV